MRRTTMLIPLLAVAMGLSARASAAECRAKIQLGVTTTGAAADVSGTADKRSDGSSERFRVSMDARVSAGTTFAVFVNGSALVGTITIDNLGNGQLDLTNSDGKVLPAGVSPVCSIGMVDVRDSAGAVVLFGAL